MVKDAEAHAADDKKKRETIEARNQADSMIYSTEKSLKDVGDKIDAVEKGNIENKIADLKKVMDGDDAESIKKATEELAQAAHKLAEAMYANAKPEGGAEAGQPDQGQQSAGAGSKPKEDNVVDADFEEVKK